MLNCGPSLLQNVFNYGQKSFIILNPCFISIPILAIFRKLLCLVLIGSSHLTVERGLFSSYDTLLELASYLESIYILKLFNQARSGVHIVI
jgi:hypothetical protein